MKTVNRILVAAIVLGFVSCSKENVKENGIKVITDFPLMEVECEVDAPVVESGAALSSSPSLTKVYGYEADPDNAPGVHTVKWKAGDQISQFSIVYSNTSAAAFGTLLNFSHLRSTLQNGDGTKQFMMTVPNLQELYGKDSGVSTYLCAIYPATTFSDISVTLDGSKIHAVATPEKLTIPAEQDGTGWKYSVFIARSATFSAQYNNPAGGGKSTFHLMNVLLRLKLNSSKNITKVVLTNTTGFMTGDVGTINMGYYHYPADVAKNFTLATGCPGKTLTVENGGEVLPNDLYFAIREMREGTTFTFTFTAEDGTTATRSLENPAGYANRKMKKVLSLGTVTLADSDFN